MRNLRARIAAIAALAAATALSGVVLGLDGVSASAADATSVTVAGQTHALNGVNIYRSANFLVEYTPAFGASTGTNQYGYEAAVVNGVVTKVANGVGNMAIPSNGFVLSGHGTSRTFLADNATVGATVTLNNGPPPPPPGGQPMLPDLGIRTLRQFTIANVNGVKELKFPAVMPNVGHGPFEIHGTRSSSTSTDWVGTQTIYYSDGTKVTHDTPGVTFFYAGDGHNHWHVRELQEYQIYNSNGVLLNRGTQAKQGFCFEDNTSYRDWPQKHTNGAPSSPVYMEGTSCGVGHPEATSIQEGLSVGWGDTYPATLPDQYIDITGLPDGVYTVKVIADWANWYQESNENNNSASASVRITGNTVTLLSAPDGL
jgi:hypothetical protein